MLEDAQEAQATEEAVHGAAPETSEAILRAEEAVDRLGEQVGRFVSSAGHSFLRFTARAREEAEDMWAEAQSIRHGQMPDADMEDMDGVAASGHDGSAAPNADEALAE